MSVFAGPNIVTSGLILHLDAADTGSYPGSGTTWYDVSGNGSNGTIVNSPSFVTANNSFSFNGTNNYVNIIPTTNTVRLSNCSIQFVVNLPAWSGGQRCILSFRAGGSSGQLYIGKQSGGIFSYYNSLSTPNYTVGSIADGATAHCVITCDSTNNILSQYINGVLAGSVSRTSWNTNYNTSGFNLGYDAGGTAEYMVGNFYSFSHYNKVLTATEIQQNFNAFRGRYSI